MKAMSMNVFFYPRKNTLPVIRILPQKFLGSTWIILIRRVATKVLIGGLQIPLLTIVGDFLSSKTNAVVYVCDPSDGRDKARFRKFNSWYKYHEYQSHKILQFSIDMDAGGITLHTALLVHRDNKLKNRFIEAYLDLTDGEKDWFSVIFPIIAIKPLFFQQKTGFYCHFV